MMRIALLHIEAYLAVFQGPPGDAREIFAILVALLLLFLSAVAALILGVFALVWLLRPSGKEVDVVPLQTGDDVVWVPVPAKRRAGRTGSRTRAREHRDRVPEDS